MNAISNEIVVGTIVVGLEHYGVVTRVEDTVIGVTYEDNYKAELRIDDVAVVLEPSPELRDWACRVIN